MLLRTLRTPVLSNDFKGVFPALLNPSPYGRDGALKNGHQGTFKMVASSIRHHECGILKFPRRITPSVALGTPASFNPKPPVRWPGRCHVATFHATCPENEKSPRRGSFCLLLAVSVVVDAGRVLAPVLGPELCPRRLDVRQVALMEGAEGLDRDHRPSGRE